MKKLLLAIILSINVFAYDIYEGWHSDNATKFNYFLGLQLADVLSTNYALNTGRGVESNPLLGDNPNLEKLLLFKAVTIPLTYYALDNLDEKWKGYILNTINVLYLGVVGNNLMIGFRGKF